MKNGFLYKFLKGFADKSVRLANRNLPSLKADQAIGVLLPVPTFRPSLPQNFVRLPAALASLFQEEISLPAVHLFQLHQVNISWNAVVFRGLRMFLPALAHLREDKHYTDTYLLQQWTGQLRQPPADEKELVLVHNQWTNGNYYHWMVDALPRLLLLPLVPTSYRLLMLAPVPAFVRDSAALLGFTNFLALEPGETLSKTDLLVPEHVTPPGYQHPTLLRLLREALLKAVYQGEAPPPTYRKVYVSRRRQQVRQLLNEADIASVLTRHGYETVEFEGLSLVEQVRLMAETITFVTVHGAGMTNMLFLSPGAQVAELLNADKLTRQLPEHFENLIYFRMAAALGLAYYCLPCANVDHDPPTNNAHLCVDAVALDQLLRQMAAERVMPS